VVARLHVMCRANQGRSPVFAALLREQAAHWGVEAHVTSSGLEARPDVALLPTMAAAWRRHGHPALDHRSRVYDPDDVRKSEVTLVFEAAHRARLVNELPTMVPRVFTVREATRLVSSPRWDPEWSGSSYVITHLHRMRGYVEPADDDTPDPARMRRSACRRLLTELEKQAEVLGEVLFGPRGA
jgi:protein-tyrosine-phosphatase